MRARLRRAITALASIAIAAIGVAVLATPASALSPSAATSFSTARANEWCREQQRITPVDLSRCENWGLSGDGTYKTACKVIKRWPTQWPRQAKRIRCRILIAYSITTRLPIDAPCWKPFEPGTWIFAEANIHMEEKHDATSPTGLILEWKRGRVLDCWDSASSA